MPQDTWRICIRVYGFLALCWIYTAQRRRRLYVLVETSTFQLFWVKHEPSSTDILKYFYKRNNNKKTIISNWTYFSYADWLVSSLCETKMCFTLVWYYFDNTHVKTHAILSFFLNWTCSNVVVLCLQWTPTVIYLYLVWIINWPPVWLEYCWHPVNLDEQTSDIGVLRKKNYSFFL